MICTQDLEYQNGRESQELENYQPWLLKMTLCFVRRKINGRICFVALPPTSIHSGSAISWNINIHQTQVLKCVEFKQGNYIWINKTISKGVYFRPKMLNNPKTLTNNDVLSSSESSSEDLPLLIKFQDDGVRPSRLPGARYPLPALSQVCMI